MRDIARLISGALALAAIGCSGADSGVTPTPDLSLAGSSGPAFAGSVNPTLGDAIVRGDIANTALGIYAVDIDLDTMTATSSLEATRAGQANDDVYLLGIDSFLAPDSLQITGIVGDAETVRIDYLFAHPFSAPSDPTGTPNGSTNRADLGISGMALFLLEVPDAVGYTYFTDVTANTAMVTNADGYYQPAGLLTTTGIANTYPYRLLVDETGPDGSRKGVSNGGEVTGNFGANGWTLGEMGGAPFNEWTGYGVLHQGQTSIGQVALSREELATSGFSFDVAIVAKYNDPRAGANAAERKANRLPRITNNPLTDMAYRMPHGAIDVQKIAYTGTTSGAFVTNAISAATLTFTVEDWDARGIETAEADLAAETDVTKVAIGEAGLPDLAICIPGVLGDDTTVDQWDPSTDVEDDDTPIGGDSGEDSGHPGDALYYSKSVTKSVTSGQTAGSYTGLVKAEDVESAIADPFFTVELDGSLTPLTANIPTPVSYQSFEVVMNTPPTATVALTNPIGPALLPSGTAPSLAITSIADPDNGPIDIDVDWGDGAGFVNLVNFPTPPYANQTPTGGVRNNADLITDSINVVVRVSDGISTVDYPLSYTLGANRAPVVTGTPALNQVVISTGGSFTMNQSTASAVDPEGDAITYLATTGTAPLGPFPNASGQAAFPVGGIGPYPSAGTVAITMHARDALHGNTGAAPAADNTGRWAAVNGTVSACVNLGLGGTALTGAAGLGSFANVTGGSVISSCDTAAWNKPTFHAGGGVIWQFLSGANWDIVQTVPTGATASAGGTITGVFQAAAAGLTNMRVNQLEVDTSAIPHRVIFTRVGSSVPNSTGAWGTPTQMYIPTTGAFNNFYVVTYVGTPASSYTMIPTPAPIIAMTVDANGNVYTIDPNHIMRKYLRSTSYGESAAAPFPINLAPIIGSNVSVGDTNRKVGDFIINEYNQNFFILLQSQGAAGSPGNCLVYRVECDGTAPASVAGNPNPLRFVGNASTTQSVAIDIGIDQYNTSGGLLGAQSERQIFLTTGNVSYSRAFMNANMQLYYTIGILAENHGVAMLNNWIAGQYVPAGVGTYMSNLTPPPANYQ